MVKLLSILLKKALEINKKISLGTIGIMVTQKIISSCGVRNKSLDLSLRCVWFGWKQGGWKIGRGKYGEKCCFLLFGWGKKIEETENRGEIFPFGAHFFYPPKLGGK